MTDIRNLAEPLHWHVAGHNLAAHDVECFNAGIDTLVDAVENSGSVLVPRELVTDGVLVSRELFDALRNDLGDLERALQKYREGHQLVFDATPFLQENWPAVRELVTTVVDP